MNRTARILLATAAAAAALLSGRLASPAPAADAATASPSPAPDAPAKPAAGPTVVSLTVRPQATTRPALRVRLLPTVADLVPGDAAPLYLQACQFANRQDGALGRPVSDDDARRFGVPPGAAGDWTDLFLAAPLDKLGPADKVGPADKLRSKDLNEYLSAYRTSLSYLELASRRDTCRWDLPIREQGFATLLPYLSPLRDVARAGCVKARTQLAAGDFAGAAATLRGNFALVRGLGQQAVLVQTLVAAGIAAATLDVVREAAGVPGSPNLYWALTDLPQPLLDLRSALHWERASVTFTFPQLVKVRDGTFAESDWPELVRQFRVLTDVNGQVGVNGPGGNFGSAFSLMIVYPQAREFLVRRGTPAEQVDALPPAVALARYLVGSYDEAFDEIAKWSGLPFWQGREGAERAVREFVDRERRARSNPLLEVVPAIGQATFQVGRADRDVAVARAVEALRAHAATHGGGPPATLDELAGGDTPVPYDPITGKPFVYRVDGATATLESPAPSAGRPRDGLLVRVTFVK